MSTIVRGGGGNWVEADGTWWHVTIERADEKIIIHKFVPNDELEYAVDEVLSQARMYEGTETTDTELQSPC